MLTPLVTCENSKKLASHVKKKMAYAIPEENLLIFEFFFKLGGWGAGGSSKLAHFKNQEGSKSGQFTKGPKTFGWELTLDI